MKWRVRLLRKAGRRIPWKSLVHDPGQVGTIRTQVCSYGSQGPFAVAVLSGESASANDIELLEPKLHMMCDEALILRGFERLQNDHGPLTVLQEWRCELA
jgi:hypothetical protein